MSQKKNIFLGIDLGTTNSSIACVSENSEGNLQVEVQKIPMLLEDRWEDTELLPSFVYFPQNGEEPYIGAYAKHMMSVQSSQVIRSVKSFIGQPIDGKLKTWTFSGRTYLPQDISAMFLRTLLKGMESKFSSEYIDYGDVVVTVPACFDPDMCAATLEAVAQANIRITKKNGGHRDVLLHEPRATLFDFIHQLRSGAILNQIVDFNTEQTVLVYDIGGGTLDVSIHTVKYSDDKEKLIDFRDIGVSRYTKIGGDNFDEKFTDHLYTTFLTTNKLDDAHLSETERGYIKKQLFVHAERYKVQTTNSIIFKTFNSQDPIDFRKESVR